MEHRKQFDMTISEKLQALKLKVKGGKTSPDLETSPAAGTTLPASSTSAPIARPPPDGELATTAAIYKATAPTQADLDGPGPHQDAALNDPKMREWAHNWHQLNSEGVQGGPAMTHGKVDHSTAHPNHLLWFYGPRTPDQQTAEKYFNFKVYNRKTGVVEAEAIPRATKLGMEFLFEDLRSVDSSKFIKHMLVKETIRMGTAYNSPKSAAHIPGFVKEFNLPLDVLAEPDLTKYPTFNSFFSRKLRADARPIASPESLDIVSSIADCRLSVFPTIALAKQYWIKGQNFTLENLLQDRALAERFDGGSLGIFRLAPQDYHRWHVPASGTIKPIKHIDGCYYTVNPKAIKENLDVYTENARHVSTLSSTHLGEVGIVAVGAMLVGSINLTVQPGATVARGQEMGYFEFGGSTCILLFEKGKMKWDDDLVERSQNGMETLVEVGEKIGEAIPY
ncbi:hypothetical protein HKX48_004553 [Thoreauomyces humboldtii]|nr:hypothetical protein HKX48_004553 [Thoreauomyces humboldtii]